jgi:hypothetical protein
MLDKIKNIFGDKKQTESKPKGKVLSAKEQATKNKEPYVAVLDTHLNTDNPRNGFFELDWNSYFIDKLKMNGYRGESEEEVVNRWFTELCSNIAKEEQVAVPEAGYVNIVPRKDGKTEVS